MTTQHTPGPWVAKRTMTLNLTGEEMDAVERYASHHQMSKTAVLRQALRLYDMVQHRLADGETMSFSGDQQRAMAFSGIGFPMQDAWPYAAPMQDGALSKVQP